MVIINIKFKIMNKADEYFIKNLNEIKFNIDEDCSSTCKRAFFSLASSYKAKEYLSAEVIENPLFLLNLVPLLC